MSDHPTHAGDAPDPASGASPADHGISGHADASTREARRQAAQDVTPPGVHAHHRAGHTVPGHRPGSSGARSPEAVDAAHAAHAAGGLAVTDHAAHDQHAGHSVAMFRTKFWVALVLTLPTLVWGHMLQGALRYSAPAVPGARWIPAVFGTAVFADGGRPFLQGAVRELHDRLPGMMTLIALAISVAFGFSAAVLLGFPGMPLWEELATLVTIMLLGHWLEMRSISQAQGALGELAKLLPAEATRVGPADALERVPIASVRVGDLLLVRPGERVPADGMVRAGESAVDEAVLTGESRPVDKHGGDRVIAGAVNGTGALRVEVTGTGDATALAGIMRLVGQAQASRSRAQALADRAAFWLTWIALGSGAVTLAAWLAAGAGAATAVERLVTVLVIACPHALGLAIPLVVAISTTIGARNGLLVRARRGLEDARNLTTVVFDKTGTLTLGEHRVVALRTADGMPDDAALRLAAGLEREAEHPVARAIVASAEERRLALPPVAGFRAMPGRGVEGVVEGRTVRAGGPNLLAGLGAEPSAALRAFADDAAGRGQGVIYLVEEGPAPATAGHASGHTPESATHAVRAAFAVADAPRPESAEAVRALQAVGIEVVLLTGDAEAVAAGVARALGITAVFAQVLPEEKAARIQALQRQGQRVAMVGDGVNDAPALLTADVGIAIGAGTDVAVEAGDVVLVRSDPRDVARLVALSRATYRKMIQNLWWAAGYNVVAIPLAAGVLAPWGVVLSPAVGAVLMSLSTVIVALNAQLLRRAHL